MKKILSLLISCFERLDSAVLAFNKIGKPKLPASLKKSTLLCQVRLQATAGTEPCPDQCSGPPRFAGYENQKAWNRYQRW